MNTPWLDHYDAGVPKSIGVYPEKTLVDFIREHASATPGKPALLFKGRKLSFAEIDRLSDSFARGLRDLGVKEGDRVAFILPNAPQFIIAELAVWKLGAIIAPQSPIYTERELTETLNVSKPDVMIVLTPFYEKVKTIQANTTIKRVIATNIKEYLPGVLRILFTLVKEKKEGHRIELHEGDVWFQSLLKEGSGGRSRPPAPEAGAAPHQPAVVLMSGGTTGTPKGVMSDHRSLIMAGTQISAWLREAIAGPEASIMLPLPLFHTYGCAGAQTLAFIAGIPLILVPNPRDIDDLGKTISRDRPTLFCGVPAMFNALLNHKMVLEGKVDFKSIRACFSGAAPLMAETKKRFEDLTGGRIVEGYSLTESTMACFINPYRGANKIGSVGMPISDVIVRIVDADDSSKEMKTGEVGEILIHAPQLMKGYWNNPTETAEMMRTDAAGKKWLYTGDLGYLDEDGYLFIVDRKKDLIKASGFQVWPREIEEVIATHPQVAEVGVAGVPDAAKGEVITAWIVPRAGQTIDTEALRTFCREKLAPYKIPSRIEFRTELPKTMVGKVLRRALVAESRSAAAKPPL